MLFNAKNINKGIENAFKENIRIKLIDFLVQFSVSKRVRSNNLHLFNY